MAAEWPIFFKDDLKLGNPDSSVGICTLWTKKQIIHDQVPESMYNVCGQMYTIPGINPMMKNILAKPNIRYIVLCGADLMRSGDALVNLMEKGIDKERKIIDSSGYIDGNVPEELVEKFRENVEVIDMRGRENEVPAKVKELENKKPFMEPIFITELDKTPAGLKTEEVAFKVRGKGISDAWLKLLDVIMKFGDEKVSQYKTKMKEVIDLIVVIEGDDEIKPWMQISENDIEKYFKTFFNPEKPEGVVYTYGNRLFKHPTPDGHINQIEEITKLLKKEPNTRRAVAVMWNVDLDRNPIDQPCINELVFNIKGGKLHQTVLVRSHDMYGAWPLNVHALRKLQKDMAEKLEIPVGPLVTISTSAHIYENNWKEAQMILDKNHTHKMTMFEEDKNGYFIINVDKDIVVEHYTNEGLPSGQVFRGQKAQKLFREIVASNLISLMDHAAYMGHELARAEQALREGKKFKMDEA